MKRSFILLISSVFITFSGGAYSDTGVACAAPGICSYTDTIVWLSIARSRAPTNGGVGIKTASPAARAKQICLNNAKNTGEKCADAYKSLEPMCAALTGYFGARLGAKFWEKALGSELDDRVKSAISLGASTAGLGNDDSFVNCTYLTAQALEFCEKGAQKMAEDC